MEGRPKQILYNLLLFFLKLNHAYLAYLTAQVLEMELRYTYSKIRWQLNLIMIIIQNQNTGMVQQHNSFWSKFQLFVSDWVQLYLTECKCEVLLLQFLILLPAE